ncbi:DUF2318 domain-containing protein [Anaeropeptidivorans aminofermentans]|uniref:DUF2318 domain-containing protein n=1 Tax=Anaeropeptidivorans aminofermentans TaxID=2934315 RepID=UPI002024F57A|nr:DUF2318 domain-containing protein [Anaeropeptidivorans aminofermentans]
MRLLKGINNKNHMKRNRKKLKTITAVSMTLLLAMLTGCSSAAVSKESSGNSGNANKEENTNSSGSSGGDLVIPLSGISEEASFYPMEVEGISLEVIAVKDSEGTIRTAFNTCQICYDSGRGYYEQSGDVLICQNCGNRFKMSQVEVQSGGCNPWPIFAENKIVDDENITISQDFLKEATVLFENWKVEY